MNDLVQALWREFGFIYIVIASSVLFVLALEMAFPREAQMALKDRLRVILFAALAPPVAVVCAGLLSKLYGYSGLTPLIPSVGFADAVIAVLLADLVYYWFHRAQHAIPWLWRIHSVHHSAEKLGAGAGFHHILEVPLNTALVAFPTALIFGGHAGSIAAFVVVLNGFYLHSTTRISFGRFAWLICDNRAHRIHHSLDPAHFGTNYGVITLVWDRLFGTACLPRAGEWPATGLEGQPEPKGVREWLSLKRPLLDRPPSGVPGDGLERR